MTTIPFKGLEFAYEELNLVGQVSDCEEEEYCRQYRRKTTIERGLDWTESFRTSDELECSGKLDAC